MVRLQSEETQNDWIAVAGLTLMMAWFCDGMIFADKIPLFRDLGSYFYPIKFTVAQALHEWKLPLWDRHMAAGFPIMAGIQSAVFYPPSLIFAFLPFFCAIQVSFLLHFTIAVIGSFLLFRSWKCPPFISAIGAILFTFGGTTVSLVNVLNHFQSAVWLPWVIWQCERTLKIGGSKNFVLFVLILFCQLLGGSPEIFAMSLLLASIDVIRLYRDREIRSSVKGLTLVVAAVVVAVGLAMVQLLPTIELISQSRRDQAIPAAEALAWSLQPVSLIGLLLPTAETDTTLSLGVRLLFSNQLPFLISHYLGFIALVGISLWVYHVRTSERVALIVLLVVSLLLAFGRSTPVYPFLYDHVAVLRIVRFPEKLFYLTFAILIFTAVRGLSRLTETETMNSRSPLTITICILCAWSAVYIFLRWNTPLLVQFLASQGSTEEMAVTAPTLASIFFTLEKQIAFALVAALLFSFRHFQLIRAPLFEFLLVVSVCLDLSLAHKPLQFLRAAEFIDKAPRILTAPPDDHSRLFYYPPGNSLHPSYLSVLAKPSYDKTVQLAFNNLLPNTGILFGFEYFQDIDALARWSYNDFLYFANPLPREKRSKLLAALNVRYLISFRSLEIPGVKLVREFPEHFSWLYEVSDPVNRAYVVAEAIYERGPQNTLTRMTSDEFDPRRQVVLDAPVNLHALNKPNNAVVISRYENKHVEIDAQLADAGILVLTDSLSPGWRVYVDGKEGKILRANYFFRGVELPGGKHRVKFVYDPLSFKIGLIISCLTATFLILVPLVSVVRRKRRFRQLAESVSNQPARALAD